MPWVHDFFEIDLSKVENPDLAPDWSASQHGYTREQMREWVGDLQQVQSMRDLGYTDQDFQAMRDSPEPASRKLGEAHHMFYDHSQSSEDVLSSTNNNDFVKVDWNNERYEITNGRHRIAVAKEMGMQRIPAHVSAPDAQTLDRLRSEMGPAPDRDTPVWERQRSVEPDRSQTRER